MKKSLLLFFILVVALQKSFAQTTPFIYTDTVTPFINLAMTEAENDIYINSDETIFPVSRTITVPFRTIGTFNPGNVFNIVLSDTSGNFNTPSSRIIGTLTASGIVGNRSVDVVIPYSQLISSDESLLCDTIPSSLKYRVRVESTDPVIIGTLNATSLLLGTPNIMIATVEERDESLTAQDMAKVIDWLQKTLVAKETEFCWKRTTTRSIAPVPNDIPKNCKDGYIQSGLLCYLPCNSGYYNVAGVCWENCPNGWIDGGIFCYPQVGTVLSPSALGDCPAEYDNTGIECYRWVKSVYYPSRAASCPSGYTNMGLTCTNWETWQTINLHGNATCPSGYFLGVLDRCYYNCGSGWINDGDFCRRPDDHMSYANGMYCPAGYDPTPTYAFGRCYQKCGEGWYSTGEFCQISQATKDKSSYVQSSPPTTFVCNSQYDTDAGLCYPKCPSGLDGVGPVCWTRCGPMVECGAGCATSTEACATTIVSQVVATVMLVKSIVTTILAAPTGGVALLANKAIDVSINGVRKVVKAAQTSSKTAKAMINLTLKAQKTVRAASLSSRAVRITKVAYANFKQLSTGQKFLKGLEYGGKVHSLYSMGASSYKIASRDNIVLEFGPEIDRELKSRFNTLAYNQIAEMWAGIKFDKFAANLGFDIADPVLTALSLVADAIDQSGITSGVIGVVQAFTKPICDIAPNFPTLSKSYK
jgi:hypothetical protein